MATTNYSGMTIWDSEATSTGDLVYMANGSTITMTINSSSPLAGFWTNNTGQTQFGTGYKINPDYLTAQEGWYTMQFGRKEAENGPVDPLRKVIEEEVSRLRG